MRAGPNIPQTILALDVGGTFIKSALFRDGTLARELPRVPSRSDQSAQDIEAALRGAVASAMAEARTLAAEAPGTGAVDAIGVAIPGPFGYTDGIYRMKHKFAAVEGRCLRDFLPELPVRFVHDANGFLLGEARRGAARGRRRAGGLVLGTGLGAAFLEDGVLRVSALGSPAEEVSLYARPMRGGTVEDFVSARGLLRSCPAASVKELAARARDGDASARAAWRSYGEALREALEPWFRDLRPETIVVGGQISRSLDLFAPALEDLPLLPSTLGENAALEGAAGLFQ